MSKPCFSTDYLYRITLKIEALPLGMYNLFVNGKHQDVITVDTASPSLKLKLSVDGEETDIVVIEA